ncbi:MAG: hypothetical protein PHP31_08940 [Lentimicrobiaceae bacterium]|nr:hypothetical protein [Lentimicrobiaceae bacterium]
MIIVNDKKELKELVKEVVQEVADNSVLKAEHRKLYRKVDAAKKMNISLSYLYKLINAGAIPTTNNLISGEVIDWYTGISKTTEAEKKQIAEFLQQFKK